jgi:hypothetical protein
MNKFNKMMYKGMENLENHMIFGIPKSEPKKAFDCDSCGSEIFEGDDVTTIEQSDCTNKHYCEVCIRFMTRPAEIED